jgi:hypothetical protein
VHAVHATVVVVVCPVGTPTVCTGTAPGVPAPPDPGGPSPQDVALRGVMQALVRIQAYSLADMVVAILAEDLAVGRQRCEEGSESESKVCVAFAPSLSWLPCLILPKHTGGSQCK